MFILRRILLYLNPILFIAGAELIRVQETSWWVFFLISLILLLVTIWEFAKRKLNKRFFNFLIAPLIFFLSSFSFLLFVENALVYRIAAIGSAFLLFLFLDQVLNYFYFSFKYQPYTLESFSFYTNIFAVFFLSTSLFSALIFLHYNRFLIAAIGLLFIGLMAYQIFWVNKISWAKSHLFVFIIPLCLTELFLAISYLPTSFFVNAFLISILFYLMIGLSRQFLLETINRKNVIYYLSISAAAIVAILATAQWS
jgi:hypothetical protein